MKAKKIETFYDKYFNTVVYEYRGHKYEVTYAKSWNCSVTPAHIQHKDAQAKIDEMLDNPKKETGYSEISGEPIEPIEKQLDDIFKMFGWD